MAKHGRRVDRVMTVFDDARFEAARTLLINYCTEHRIHCQDQSQCYWLPGMLGLLAHSVGADVADMREASKLLQGMLADCERGDCVHDVDWQEHAEDAGQGGRLWRQGTEEVLIYCARNLLVAAIRLHNKDCNDAACEIVGATLGWLAHCMGADKFDIRSLPKHLLNADMNCEHEGDCLSAEAAAMEAEEDDDEYTYDYEDDEEEPYG